MKSYIISFYQQEISDDELVEFLDEQNEILNWRKELPNTVFVVSNKNAHSLSKLLAEEFPESLFIIAEYSTYNSDGLLDEESWEFLNNPEEA
jgi:phosphoglycolate phosphatase-like HAD superfamily hydrolase